jgi:hypothetical protein
MASGSVPAWRHSRAGCRAIGSFSSLGGALEDSGRLGQQVSAPVRELAREPHGESDMA